MPEVDLKSVVVWGDSGGGSLVLEIAGETSVAAVVAQEPATVLFSGMYTKESLGGKPPFTSSSGSGHAIMADPKKYYTPELQKFTRAKIKKMNAEQLQAMIDQVAGECIAVRMRMLNRV